MMVDLGLTIRPYLGPGTGTFGGFDPAFCFVAGTKIFTEKGFINIEDIKIGDLVYSLDLKNNSVESARVIQNYKRTAKSVYELTIDEEHFLVTEEHPFYVVEKGWVKVRDLSEGDLIKAMDNTKYRLGSLKKIPRDFDVYNLRVEGNHNYFVGIKKVLVHNK